MRMGLEIWKEDHRNEVEFSTVVSYKNTLWQHDLSQSMLTFISKQIFFSSVMLLIFLFWVFTLRNKDIMHSPYLLSEKLWKYLHKLLGILLYKFEHLYCCSVPKWGATLCDLRIAMQQVSLFFKIFLIFLKLISIE